MTTEPPTIAFIVGTGRCGSTLVQEVLSRHPDVGFVSNVDNALPFLNPLGSSNNALYRRLPTLLSGRTTSGRRSGWGGSPTPASLADRLIERTRLRFAPSEAYGLLARRVSRLVVDPDHDLTAEEAVEPVASRFRGFFAERIHAQRRRVFLHHFTGWPRVAFIHAILPEARFIHVVRDGRAVAASLVRASWWRGRDGPQAWGLGALPTEDAAAWEASDRSPAVLAALEWKLLIDAFDRARSRVPQDQCCELRYEDFVREPRPSVAGLLDFLGLAWTGGFERQFARCSFEAGRLTAYERELDPQDLERINACLGEHLRQLGYSLPG